MLRRNPAFSAAVVLMLALGIAMNTAMFTAIDAVLLHKVTYPDANPLMWIANYDSGYQSDSDLRVLPSDYAVLKRRASSFETMAAYNNEDLALVYHGEGAAERIPSVTRAFWEITGAAPKFGRLFQAPRRQDSRPTRPWSWAFLSPARVTASGLSNTPISKSYFGA